LCSRCDFIDGSVDSGLLLSVALLWRQSFGLLLRHRETRLTWTARDVEPRHDRVSWRSLQSAGRDHSPLLSAHCTHTDLIVRCHTQLKLCAEHNYPWNSIHVNNLLGHMQSYLYGMNGQCERFLTGKLWRLLEEPWRDNWRMST